MILWTFILMSLPGFSYEACQQQTEASVCTKEDCPKTSSQSSSIQEQNAFLEKIAGRVSLNLEMSSAVLTRIEMQLSAEKRSGDNQNSEFFGFLKNAHTSIRILLALSKADRASDTETPASPRQDRIDPTPQHSISQFSEMEPLTAAEIETAESFYESDTRSLKRTFESSPQLERLQKVYKGKLHDQMAAYQKELSSFMQKGRKFEKEAYKNLYLNLLSQYPFLGFIKSANPSIEEIQKAVKENKQINFQVHSRFHTQMDKDLNKSGIEKRDALINLFEHNSVIEAYLSKNPNDCSVAEQLQSLFNRKERNAKIGTTALLATATAACIFATKLTTACAWGGIGLSGYTYLSATQNYSHIVEEIIASPNFQIEGLNLQNRSIQEGVQAEGEKRLATFLSVVTLGASGIALKNVAAKVGTKAIQNAPDSELNPNVSVLWYTRYPDMRTGIDFTHTKILVDGRVYGTMDKYNPMKPFAVHQRLAQQSLKDSFVKFDIRLTPQELEKVKNVLTQNGGKYRYLPNGCVQGACNAINQAVPGFFPRAPNLFPSWNALYMATLKAAGNPRIANVQFIGKSKIRAALSQDIIVDTVTPLFPTAAIAVLLQSIKGKHQHSEAWQKIFDKQFDWVSKQNIQIMIKEDSMYVLYDDTSVAASP